jgi:hypothetical protein
MRSKFTILFISMFSLATSAGVLEDFDAESLRDGFAQNSLCGSREAAATCLLMPWPAGLGEGAVIIGEKAYIFLRKDKKTKEFSDLISRLPVDKQDEYAAILAILINDSKNSIGVVGVGTIFVCWVNVTNGEITFDSISKFQLRDLLFFKSQNGGDLVAKLKAATDVWSPPTDYFPSYEFSYVE